MNSAALKYDRGHCTLRGSIKRVTKKKNESNFMVNASVVLFLNRGQNYLLIDDQVLIEPGGFHKETNVCTNYSWRFIENLDPPTANKPLVFPGNHLSIRIGNAPIESWIEMDLHTVNSVGGNSTTTDTPADINLTAFGNIINTDFTIPAGAIYVKVKNVGSLTPGNITINGSIEIGTGSFFERTQDWDGVNRYILPTYDIVSGGQTFQYYYETANLI